MVRLDAAVLALCGQSGPGGRGNKSSPLFFTSLPLHKQLLWLSLSQPHALFLAWPPASPARQPTGTPVLTSCASSGGPNAADPQVPSTNSAGQRASTRPRGSRPGLGFSPV